MLGGVAGLQVGRVTIACLALPLAAARVLVPVRVLGAGADEVWHLGEAVLGLLRQRVPRYRLKCLFYVDGLLGRGFKVRNVVLSVTPLLSPLCTNRSVVQIHFVSKNNEGKVVGVTRARLNEELISPAVEGFEGV